MNPVPSSARTLRVVFDTNVILSGLIRPGGNEDAVLQLGIEGEIQVFISPFILAEVERVLGTKFRWPRPLTERVLANIQFWATVVEPTQAVTAVHTDPDDNNILECCLESQADYLVTGDRRDLLPLGSFQNTRIINAAAFLREMTLLEPPA
jgi:putative PIN family toxin of toxin-antitoxin system